ncbi:MAG: hypothetical protein F6J90_35395 [Moorea sp. SIOASIH]|uniref:SdrD B-like domain-containing protein n=1 Tax=Moorena sp. SIOASIH TaxID=2607817 RepID=UPI0013BCD194|nr:SdrD B-like domain-containing protein [Moorena sp. SIOASIH]NEO41329.1 hypothetical protein [Moorena sp. SIOASIH]
MKSLLNYLQAIAPNVGSKSLPHPLGKIFPCQFLPHTLIGSVMLVSAIAGYATPVSAASELQLVKVANDADGNIITEVPSGQEFIYTIRVSCSGDEDCQDVVITDLLPPQIDWSSNNVSILPGRPATVSYDEDTGQATVEYSSPIPAGSPVNLEIRVQFPPGTTVDNTAAINQAEGTSANTENATSNALTVTSDVDSNAALNKWTLEKNRVIPSNGDPALDSPVTYELELCHARNLESGINLQNVVVQDTLPVGSSFVSATDGGTHNSGVVTWNVGNLSIESGQNCFNAQVSVEYPSGTFNTTGPNSTVINPATATGELIDGTELNLNGEAEHGFTDANYQGTFNSKSFSGQVAIGNEFEFRLDPRNTGNVPMTTLTVTDDLDQVNDDGINLLDQVRVTKISTGRYNNYTGDVIVRYKTNLNPLTAGTSHPQNTTLTIGTDITLGAGEYITGVEFEYTNVPVGFQATASSNRPKLFVEVQPDREIGETIKNCAQLTWTPNSPTNPLEQCQETEISALQAIVNPNKRDETQSGPYAPGDTIEFRLQFRNESSATADYVNPIIADLLPAGLDYGGAWRFDSVGSTSLPDNAEINFEAIPNYNGTGRTLLRWQITGTQIPENRWLRIYVDTVVEQGVSTGSLTNELFIMSNDSMFDCNNSNRRSQDTFDVDGDGITDETICRRTANVEVAGIATLDSQKVVQGEVDTSFSTSGTTVPGGRVDYQLTITNQGTVPMTNILVVDILPAIGDTQVLNTSSARGSQWRPNLAGPVSVAIPGVTVEYTTNSNPCRPNPTDGQDLNWPSGCVNDWSTTFPSDPSAVTALRFNLGNLVLDPLESVMLNWPMRAPAGAPTNGEIAWNSFAFVSTRTDQSGAAATLLPAEPPKVGIVIQPLTPAIIGDLVWDDQNGNGIQDNSEPGINGVRVELWEDGGDGQPGTSDDTFYGFTLTAPDGTGNDGAYLFSEVPAGDYFLKFIPSANLNLSAQDQGGDETADSDADPNTGQTNVFSVNQTTDTRDLDAGLTSVDPANASLGDFVWLDTNDNGTQDGGEVGVNGVTVELYDTANTLIDSTQTSDDSNGNPGFYRFRDLTPGTYYVKFIAPPSHAFSPQDQGDDTLDSDADATGQTANITLQAGDSNQDLDAGIVPQPILGDFVWIDNNGDGLQNLGELGLNGVTVNVYNPGADGQPGGEDDSLLATTVTTNDVAGNPGFYSFSGLAAGNYFLEFIAPSGYEIGFQNVGNDDTIDSDADPSTGYTEVFALAGSEDKRDLDVGMIALPVTSTGEVSGTIYQDDNPQNDTFDNGESTLPANIRVVLYLDVNSNDVIDAGDTQQATTDTDNSGNYSFTSLEPGKYIVQVDTNDTEIPDGLMLGTSNDIPIEVTTTAVTDINFGFDVESLPNVILVKRITAIKRKDSNVWESLPTSGSPFVDGIDSPGSENHVGSDRAPEDNDPNWPNPNVYLRGLINSGTVMPGDELEYTVYFLSNGSNYAKSLRICDRVPAETTFIADAFNQTAGFPASDVGIALFESTNPLPTSGLADPNIYLTNIPDSDRGRYYSPGTSVPAGCNVPVNQNGVVVVEVGDVPQATAPGEPPNSYGFIRFRGRVK